jgi:uncharacterized membrane protein YbhN (UPF0104 family)
LHATWHFVARSLERLSTARPGFAAAAWLLYVISLVIAGARWRGFLRALGGDVSVLRATLATLGGIAAGNLTPTPGGEACRIGLVRLGGRATWQQATAAAVWDRLSELPPILVLGGMAILAVRSLASAWRTRRSSLALGVAAASRRRGRVAAFRGLARRLAASSRAGRVRRPLRRFVGYSSLLWLRTSCA